jgi:hypothetical protein
LYTRWRTVAQDPILPLVGIDLRSARRVDHDELATDPPSLAQERLALSGKEVPVKVAGEDPVDLPVREGQRYCVPVYDSRLRRACRRDLDHPGALVEPDHLARR